MLRLATLAAGLLLSASSFAFDLSSLSQTDASGGLKDALRQGAQIAVQQLGQPGGFSNNDEVRIELPGKLGKAARTLKMMGMGTQITALEDSLNSAAEAAMPQAQAVLIDAVSKMTLNDAKAILAGGQDSATQYLDKTSREQIRQRLLPIVQQATSQVGLVQQYNQFASQAAAFGVVDTQATTVENYVTEQALNGLFKTIAMQEASIRENPAAAATSLAKKVFGLL